MKTALVILASLLTSAVAGANRRCFECTDSPNPSHCSTVTECAIGQECVLKQVVTSGGQVLYNLGCQSPSRCESARRRDLGFVKSESRRSDLLTCVECCDKDFCNSDGCSFVGPKQPQRGPICFECPIETSLDQCRHLKQCDFIDVCMIRELRATTAGGVTAFEAKCTPKRMCNAFALIGRRRNERHDYCHKCCSDDYCNDQCEAPTTPATPAARSHSAAPQTTTQTATHTTTSTIKPTTQTSTTESATQTTTKTTKTTTNPTTETTTHPMTQTTTKSTTKPTTQTATKTSTATTRVNKTNTTRPTTPVTTTEQYDHKKVYCLQHNGYTYHSLSHLCFKIHREKLTWYHAYDVCVKEDATLAVINTHLKWERLKLELLTVPHHQHHSDPALWLGGKDQGSHDRNYHWPNGDSVNHTKFWAPDEPSGGAEACMVAQTGSNPTWADRRCAKDYPFICTINIFHH